MMKSILTTIAFLALAVSGLAQTRSVIVNTSGVVQSPTNFWSADVTNARSGLGLGTAATNPATAFQPSSLVLSNLSSSNGGALTNLTGSSVTGTVALASNVTGTIAISNGGSGATTAGGAKTNLGLGASNDVQFNTVNTRGIFDGTNEIIDVENNWLNYIGFGTTFEWQDTANTTYVPFAFGGTNASANAAITRTNLGLGWPALTNSNTANALLGYNTNNGNVVMPSSLTFSNNAVFSQSMSATTNSVSAGGTLFAGSGSTISFYAAEDQSRWRTNLSLGWSALTNTNTSGFNTSLYGSGTNPVLYNTNGEVVSPTNFWQVAPIVTRFVESQPTTNQTTNITAARNLHIHSLAISTTGVTNTIALPTTNSFNGDIALVVHQGPTSSVTAVRTAGAATNLVTMNQFEQTVEFVYYNSVWQFNHNQSFIEPIYFSGTNAAVNAAASRTNLGLGNSSSPEFASLLLSGLANTNSVDYAVFVDDTGSFYSTSVGAARTNLGLGATNDVTFSTLTLSSDLTFGSGDNIVLSTTNGTKIGTATNQLLGFYNQTPITQPSSTGVTTSGFTTGSVSNVHANSTFTGGIGTNAYTISDVVAHLKSLGLLAP